MIDLKKNIPLLFLIILVTPLKSSYAQDDNFSKKDMSQIISNTGFIQTKSATKTTGSPYLNENFLKGLIIQRNGAKTATIPIRYNVAKNQVEFLRKKKIFIADSKKLTGFDIYTTSSNIKFRNGYKTNAKDINTSTFLREVYNSNIKLLVLHKAILLKDLATYGTATKENKYRSYKRYYLVTNDHKFHRLKSIKKDLLNILSKDSNVLKQYADSNELDFNKESDLVKILRYYDNLDK